LKVVGDAHMNRLVAMAILKMIGKAATLTTIAAIVIAVIGNRNAWDTSIKYSNAFFITGAFFIVAGASSRLAAGQEWNLFLTTYAESFRDLGASERANAIVSASSSFNLVILGFLSGISLIIISVLVTKIF
jgi:hypothetical protein